MYTKFNKIIKFIGKKFILFCNSQQKIAYKLNIDVADKAQPNKPVI